MTSNNPAALQGWVKGKDPKTGRTFYANHVTRKTQWDAPEGWQEDPPAYAAPPPEDKEEPLPSNWEVMNDPTTGKPFYVDHARKITTWTRPTAASSQTSVSRTAPAVSSYSATSSSTSYQQQQQPYQSSYQQEAAYYSTNHSSLPQDFSDAFPELEFQVQTVADVLRPTCANCETLFSMSKRRHHCRLCGDVFCDSCSNHRVQLPLEGPEFAKPVRVCDYCQSDVDQGNFFSLRRYLTPLHLSDASGTQEGVASSSNVNCALSALTADVTQALQNPDGSQDILGSLPAGVVVPEILKHLPQEDTTQRAVCAMAALVAWEALVGKGQRDFAVALYAHPTAISDLLHVLEKSGSDRKTLYVQEEAAQILCYLTEGSVAATLGQHGINADSLDFSRTLRNMLDHGSNTNNPNLQRWATACVQHLIIQDESRACMAVNEQAAMVASGQAPTEQSSYTSVVPELMETGGIMILASLVSADDSDTRAHAVAAMAACLHSVRAVYDSGVALAEMAGGLVAMPDKQLEASLIQGLIAGGACGASLAQLLLSADDDVARMGCQFLHLLVEPLWHVDAVVTHGYDLNNDSTSYGSCRQAAVEIVTQGACLPALQSLVQQHRAMQLRKMGMETLACIVHSIGEMGRIWAQGQYEEGLQQSPIKTALATLLQEGAIETALQVLQQAGTSLGGGREETPLMRLREAAGMILGALTSCSAEAILQLQSRPQLLSSLIAASSGLTAASTLRGDQSPRCLGVLETVSALLMFTWQHPSGADNELLDRLMEVLDAGVVPYLSQVMNGKLDWESRDCVGAMKGRTAACRLLCCLFGIALGDTTGIGMRRLMQAVETDARGYRNGGTNNNNKPRNLIEAALAALQMAATTARKVLLGSLQVSEHHQAALLDLVDAGLLAAASMCGSSVAPGGSEGSLITGESFLTARNDPYTKQRNEICKVACDVVVRGGRSSSALLPTMMVGGFGPGSVLSSLRLALAIAQNGTKDQHAKLALSGILVPVTDLLKSALSKGDLYKFSAALALVRFCGPHVAAGHGGGLEAVRDAIGIATNVLTLPNNPSATLEQIETQESLKGECISALESLSGNASLWSAISQEALPSIVTYLHMTSSSSASNPRRQQTRCGALRAVLQIVHVPSHAVSAAGAGIVEPLGRLISMGESVSQDDEVPMLALEVLHVISTNDQARKAARFLETGLVRCICAALGKCATDTPKKPSDSRADVTFLGLEIIHAVLTDIEKGLSTAHVLQSSQAIAFVDAIAAEPRFIRTMCSTLLLKTNMKLARQDGEEGDYEIARLYGPPLILVPETCAGYQNTHEASAALLLRSSVYACGIESQRSNAYWKTALLNDMADGEDSVRTAATLCAHFLKLLAIDHKPFIPLDGDRHQDFLTLERPLVRYKLFETLKDSIKELSGESSYGSCADPYMTALLVEFNVPQICLASWKDPALLDLSFELLKEIVDQDPEEVLHLFVEGKDAIMSLFDLLNVDSSFESSQNDGEIKRFLANVLGQLAEGGMLTDAVEKFDVRSSAISALAAACLGEEERPPDEDEDVTSNRLSSVLMRCLVDLCTVKESGEGDKSKIRLSPGEAETMAKNLGKKICHMVISRFLERARLHQYDMEEDENIMDAPDVAMLCAISQHKDALIVLRSIGGLHALSLIAGEGEISAVAALTIACDDNASVLMEGDTYASMMKMIATEGAEEKSEVGLQLEASAFDLLGRLCVGSSQGREAVATEPHCEACVNRAIAIVSSLVSPGEDEGALEDEDSEEQQEDLRVRALESQELKLGVSVCSFLSGIAPTKIGGKLLRESSDCTHALALLARSENAVEFRYAALKLLSSFAQYASSEGALTVDDLADVLLAVLTSEHKIEATETINTNQVIYVACSGLAIIFDLIVADKQKALVAAATEHFKKAVKGCIVSRSTTKDVERSFSAEAVYNLTVVLLLSRGKKAVNAIFTNDVLTSMLHLVQWRHDPKTNLGNTSKKHWDAAISNCLLLFSTLVWRPEEELESAGLDLKTLANTSLMLARAGKAPRRAVALKAVLTQLAEGEADASASVPAQRILDRLF